MVHTRRTASGSRGAAGIAEADQIWAPTIDASDPILTTIGTFPVLEMLDRQPLHVTFEHDVERKYADAGFLDRNGACRKHRPSHQSANSHHCDHGRSRNGEGLPGLD